MKRTIEYGDPAREQLLAGVQKIAKAVKVTLGPSGKNVLIRNEVATEPFSTKDGVTVAAQIRSENYIEQIAIECMQTVANMADNKAGDGTTTATVLAEALFDIGCEKIGNHNVIDFKNGIEFAVREVVKWLKEKAVKVDDDYDLLYKVAMVASNNDKVIAKVVVDAFKVAGNQGVVNIKRSNTKETYLTTIDGMNLNTGYRSVYYINDHKNQIVDFEKPYVYITNEKITSITDNLDKLLQYVSEEQIPLLIICKDMDEAISESFIVNKRDNRLKICVCKAPGFGQEQVEELKDLGVVLGKPAFIEKELDFNSIDSDDLINHIPRVEQVIVTDQRLSIKAPIVSDEEYEEIEEAKNGRANKLREQLKTEITVYEKANIQTRISRLTDGIAYINIGATSDIEFNERQHRIQDALYSVKSAHEEGVIPGGGYALNSYEPENLETDNESFKEGMSCLFEILASPMLQILENVGIEISEEDGEKIDNEWNVGYDAREKVLCLDLIEKGIMDPVKVTRVALENASSVVGMLLTTDCVIIEDSAYIPRNNPQY